MASAFMAAAFALSLAATPAFAIGDADRFTITVNGSESGAVTSAYQLVKVDYDFTNDQPNSPTYDWANSEVKNAADAAGISIDKFNDGSLTTDDMKALAEAVVLGVRGNTLALSVAGTVTGDGTIGGLPMGVYVLSTTATTGAKVFTPASVNLVPTYMNNAWSVPNATVTLKSTTPSVDKTVDSGAGTGAQIGDKKDYELRAVVPNFPANAINTTFNLGDIFTKGLTFNNDVKVYGLSGTTETELAAGTHYTYTKDATMTDGTKATFRIDFTYSAIKQYSHVIVRYSGTVNEQAVVGSNGNQAILEFARDPYDPSNSYETDDSNATVYTYGIQANTKDENGTALPGAEYEVSKGGNKIEFVKTGDGEYRVAAPGETGTTTLVSNSADGTLKVSGLAEGDYDLTQTKAPSGFAKPSAPIKVTIKDDNHDGYDDTSGQPYVTVDVNNAKPAGGIDLPVTGGTGTVVFALAGAILVGGGIALLLGSRKKRDEN